MLVTSNKLRGMLMSVQTLMNDIVRDSKGTSDAAFYKTVAEGIKEEARSIMTELPSEANMKVADYLVSRWTSLQSQYRSVVSQFNKDPETDRKRTAADIAYDALETIGDSARNAAQLPFDILGGGVREALKALWPVLAIAGGLIVVVIVFKPKLA